MEYHLMIRTVNNLEREFSKQADVAVDDTKLIFSWGSRLCF